MEITLKNVSYRYKNRKLLDRINLKIADNRITGITGDYKTILCEIIDAVKMVSSGTVLLGNMPLEKETLKVVRKEVCVIHQNYQEQFFTDNVKDEMLFLVTRLNYQPKDINKKMSQSLRLVGLDDSYLDKNIHALSLGEKKLIQVAVGLICNPNVIIFDEVFVELDLTNTRKIIRIMKMLRDKYNKTVIVSSNNANMLYELTDDLVILKNGNILAADTTVKVYQNVELLQKNDVDIPDLVMFTKLAKNKKVKLSYHRDIRDLIKDVYKHV